MKFFKFLFVFVAAAVQAKVLNFTQYNSEWVKDHDYTLQYTYLEEPNFSKFQIRLYNSIDTKILKEVSTDDYDKNSHSVTLSYPDVSTGKYRIVALNNNEEEISNNFSVKLVLKASPTTTTTTSSLTPNATSISSTSSELKGTSKNDDNQDDKGNYWKTIAIIVSILIVILIVGIIGFILYNRYKRNKQYEEEANTSIWKVPISERSINIARGFNAYSVPNASITERDLSFSSDVDEIYSYSSQLRNSEYFSTHMGYRERQERTKSVNSYSTNVTKTSNNILDILYPEKKEKEKSLHEKSELSIDLNPSHSQKNHGQRRKKHSNSTNANQVVKNGRSKSSSEVRDRSNSFKANAMAARKSRVSMPESENKKNVVSLIENEKNAHLITAALLNENAVDITSSNVNNNISLATPISSSAALTGGNSTGIKPILSKNTNENTLSPETPEYYIKYTKLNKKYIAICNYKPKLSDEMNVNKNDVVVIREIFPDGWGKGKNITTDKEGLLPLNCLSITV